MFKVRSIYIECTKSNEIIDERLLNYLFVIDHLLNIYLSEDKVFPLLGGMVKIRNQEIFHRITLGTVNKIEKILVMCSHEYFIVVDQ